MPTAVSTGIWLAVVGALSAYLWQAVLRDLAVVSVGVGRVIQPLSDFPGYSCRRVEAQTPADREDWRLQACEDMWLDETSRTLFLACAETESRRHWMLHAGKRNGTAATHRGAIVALDIDSASPGDGDGDGGKAFDHRALPMPGFLDGFGRPSRIIPNGFAARRDPATGAVDFFVASSLPPVDPVTGEMLSHEAIQSVGGNDTIEHFRLANTDKPAAPAAKEDKEDGGEGAALLQHVATYAGPGILTPNRVAASADGKGFWLTNDHGDAKTGWRAELSPILGIADVTYCSLPSSSPSSSSSAISCRKVSTGLLAPNGLVLGPDGRLYVPDALMGRVDIYDVVVASANDDEEDADAGDLRLVSSFSFPMPIDNLSFDAAGDMWAAAFPKAFELIAGFDDPVNADPPSATFRARKVVVGDGGEGGEERWEVEKMLEEPKANVGVLPAATTVVHDAKTGRLFLSGVYSPFISVCEKTS